MKKGVVRKTHVIDAAGKPLGRLATQAAALLIGKHKVAFVPYEDRGDAVHVRGASRLVLTGKKAMQKTLVHHSLHLGGLKQIPVRDLLSRAPERVVRHAVYKMLPKNTFRAKRIKRLTIER